jgi:uncharacterized membrane protein
VISRPAATAWQALGWALVGLVAVGYALLAHRAASSPAPGLFEAGVFIVPLMGVAALVAWRSAHRFAWLVLWLLAVAALFLLRGWIAAGTTWVLLLQHVGINLLLALVFGRTLAAGQVPLLTRLARIVHGDAISPRVVVYTRNATWAWVAYFVLTSMASLLLFALAPPVVWSGFVNLLSMPLLAAMFAGEFIVRVICIPRSERSGFLESMLAYRQFSRDKK